MASDPTQPTRPLTAVILAAGKGKRMRSDLPKVMHEVGGEPMVVHVARVCFDVGCSCVIAVVGHGRELVEKALAPLGCEFALQSEQHGTGHAVMCARDLLAGQQGDTFVLCGDGPLIRQETLHKVLERHRTAGATATLATSVIDDPAGYGRIVRDDQGRFREIVEQKNATDEQLRIREVNPSYYCFDTSSLFSALDRVERNESTGEYYVTDVPAIMLAGGDRVEVIEAVPPEDVLSINTPEDLAIVDELFRARGAATRSAGGRA